LFATRSERKEKEKGEESNRKRQGGVLKVKEKKSIIFFFKGKPKLQHKHRKKGRIREGKRTRQQKKRTGKKGAVQGKPLHFASLLKHLKKNKKGKMKGRQHQVRGGGEDGYSSLYTEERNQKRGRACTCCWEKKTFGLNLVRKRKAGKCLFYMFLGRNAVERGLGKKTWLISRGIGRRIC